MQPIFFLIRLNLIEYSQARKTDGGDQSYPPHESLSIPGN